MHPIPHERIDAPMSRYKKKPNSEPAETGRAPLPFERPWVIRSLNVALYITNFLLLHYVMERISPGKGEILRLAMIWFISYLLTRIMIEVTKVPARAILTVGLGALLVFVLI